MDHMALARVLANENAYSEIVELFEPFSDDLLTSPTDNPRSVTLLILGHLGAGEINEAWAALKSIQGKIGSDAAAYLWLTSIPQVPSDSLLAAYELLAVDATFDDWSLIDSPELIRAMVSLDDPEMDEAFQSWRNEYESRGLSLAQKLQLAVTSDGIEFSDDPVEMLTRLQAAVEQVPSPLMDKVIQFPTLPPAEREAIAPIRMFVSIAMNNFVATRSKALLDSGVDRDLLDPFSETAGEYVDRLVAIGVNSPQIIDSRGMYAMAEGRLDEARNLMVEAVALDPVNANLRMSLARVYRALGETTQARDEARKSLLLARRNPNENRELINRLEIFLGSL